MRRSELAGISRRNLDLDNEFLDVEGTRVTVGGQVADSDGKSHTGVRGISLDAFTVKHLKRYLERIDIGREAFGKDYPNHGMCWSTAPGFPESGCTTSGTPTPRSRWTRARTPSCLRIGWATT
ncbi:MAG TPA: hypothetical protein VIP77_07490 [Jiangellaceae bacterium]